MGRLTKDPELRYTGNGIAVTSFTLATERNYKNAQGERETDFINCVIWRESAENLATLAVKGVLLGITGSIQTRNYKNNEGRTIYITEVVADNFQLLEPKSVTDQRRSGQQPQQNNNQNFNQQQNNNQNNFNQQQNNNQNFNQQQNNNQNNFNQQQYDDPFANNTDVTDISDDDLPF